MLTYKSFEIFRCMLQRIGITSFNKIIDEIKLCTSISTGDK